MSLDHWGYTARQEPQETYPQQQGCHGLRLEHKKVNPVDLNRCGYACAIQRQQSVINNTTITLQLTCGKVLATLTE